MSSCKMGIDGEMVEVGEMLGPITPMAVFLLPDDEDRNHGRMIAMAEKPCNVGGTFGLSMIPGHLVMNQRRLMPASIYPPPPPADPDDDAELSALRPPPVPSPQAADWFGGPDGSMSEARISGKTWWALDIDAPLSADGNGYLLAFTDRSRRDRAVVKAHLTQPLEATGPGRARLAYVRWGASL